jgi:glycosyltransferase involved in cell wall biosynthesis
LSLKQVLYISYDGLTDPLGQSQILPYLVGLSKLGYVFSIITCEKPGRFEEGRKHIESICMENGISWYPLIYHKKPPVLSTIRDIIGIRKLAFQLHAKKNFALVHCRSYISALVGLAFKRKKQVPFIFDMRGFWADERIDGGIWNLSNPVYRLVYHFFKSKEAAFIQFSDVIISLTESGKQVIHTWPTMAHSKKIMVIPCCVDMDLFNRRSLDESKIQELKTGLDAELIIGYYGSLGTWYQLEEMLDQIVAIRQKYPRAKLLVVTKDIWEKSHQSMAFKKGLDETTIVVKSAERREMPYYMAIADFSIFFIQTCFSKLASSPTKHGEIMSMGLPLMANAGVGDVDKIIHDSKSGCIVHPLNAVGYQQAVEAIPSLLELNADLIREACTRVYSLEHGLSKYAEAYQLALKNTGSTLI